MSEIKNYKVDFIKRTNEILTTEYKSLQEKDREVTFLLNCLLGLIITISENEQKKLRVFKGKIDNEFLSLIPDKVGFIQRNKLDKNIDLTETSIVSENVSHKGELIEQDKLWFINKIRNGIAHQHIEGVNEDQKWIGVRLWNTNNSFKDFEIIFSIDELKTFAISLSEKYLEENISLAPT